MNFQQLRFVREAVRQNMNLTEVANVLYTSQSGVSKQIKDLEDELGVDIFIRRGKRLTGLTEPGKAVHQLIERMLLDAENLRRVARQYADQDSGHLVVATTHTQARYALPKVIRQFTEVFPKVHLALRQGSPQQIAQMIINGEADIGISTEALDRFPDIVTFPCYSWHHIVVVPKGHPLVGRENLTLDEIAEFPIVTYDQDFTGRSHIDQAFAKAGAFEVRDRLAIDALGFAALAEQIYCREFGGEGRWPPNRPRCGPWSGGSREGQLLAGDLEQQGTEQVHRRRQHRVGMAKVGMRLLQPHRAAGNPWSLGPFPA